MADKPNDSQPLTQNAAPARVRRISADGLRWVVQEVQAPAFDRRGGTHLLFDGETIMRRVREFPKDWFDLSDDELYELSRRIPPK